MRRSLRSQQDDLKAAFSSMPSFRDGGMANAGGIRSRIQRSPTLSRIAAMGGSKGSVRVDAKIKGRASSFSGMHGKQGKARTSASTSIYMNEKKPSIKEAVFRARRLAKQNPALK
eukprot:scaffold482446_cov45-Prasinocladus_malaysianus.AAC.1